MAAAESLQLTLKPISLIGKKANTFCGLITGTESLETGNASTILDWRDDGLAASETDKSLFSCRATLVAMCSVT